MKAYAPKRMSKAEAIQTTTAAMNDLLPQMAAAWLYMFDQRGWHKDRVIKAYRDIVALYRMPPIMGKHLESDDVRDYIAMKYGIDWTELTDAAQLADKDGNVL